MSKPLTGKVALVTGGIARTGSRDRTAAGRAGRRRRLHLRQLREAGAGRRRRGARQGAKAVALKSDQADTSRAPALIDDVVAHFGGLDILVNNAAISVEQGRTVDDPDGDTAALDRMHATNYLGVIAVIRAASRVLRTGGRIITVSSDWAPGSASRALPTTRRPSRASEVHHGGRTGPRAPRHHGQRRGSRADGQRHATAGPRHPQGPAQLAVPATHGAPRRKSRGDRLPWRAPPRRTSRARCWTPTAAATPEPEPLPRAPEGHRVFGGVAVSVFADVVSR
ncbi:SDR family oxidoreductase [Streptomyces thinghirensis]|nr:SDR family oxidoreductase [Streptomyces thinghirensis]